MLDKSPESTAREIVDLSEYAARRVEGNTYESQASKEFKSVYVAEGFYPQSPEETSVIRTIRAQNKTGNPVLAYLNQEIHINRHNMNYSEPILAEQVDFFKNFATDAVKKRNSVDEFMYTYDTPAYRLQDIAATLFTDIYNDESGSLHSALTAMNEQFIAEVAWQTLTIKNRFNGPYAGYGPGAGIGSNQIEVIRANLGTMDLTSLQNLAAEASVNQDARAEYWVNNLKSAREHTIIRKHALKSIAEVEAIG